MDLGRGGGGGGCLWYVLGWGPLRREAPGHLIPSPSPGPAFCSLKVNVCQCHGHLCTCLGLCVRGRSCASEKQMHMVCVCVRACWVCVCGGKCVLASSVCGMCGLKPHPWPEHFIPRGGVLAQQGSHTRGPLAALSSPAPQHLWAFEISFSGFDLPTPSPVLGNSQRDILGWGGGWLEWVGSFFLSVCVCR